MELDEIRLEQESIYEDIKSCYGLERCLKEFDLLGMDTSNIIAKLITGFPNNVLLITITGIPANYGAGSLLASLQKEREHLTSNAVRLEAEMRERQRQIEYQKRQRAGGASGLNRTKTP